MFGSIRPFMEVGYIPIWLESLQIDICLTNRMSSINKHGNALLMIVSNNLFNREDNSRSGANMVINSQLDLSRVRVDSVLYFQ